MSPQETTDINVVNIYISAYERLIKFYSDYLDENIKYQRFETWSEIESVWLRLNDEQIKWIMRSEELRA